MLRIMHPCPWQDDMKSAIDRANNCHKSDEPILTASERSSLGPTEWRKWDFGDEELEKVIELVRQNTPSDPPF